MNTPAWSVIIPTFNRPQHLRSCLEALKMLNPPPGGYDVVIVDDGGDADLGWVQKYQGVRLIRQKNAGPAAARNAGAGEARGRFLAFTDDDCRPEPAWLCAFAPALSEHTTTLLGGHTVNGLVDNVFSAASQDLIDYLYRVQNQSSGEGRFFASNNIAMSREGFAGVGGFDESYPLAAGEDRAFCELWHRTGQPLVYLPDAVVQHEHALNLRTYWKQHWAYGRGAYRFRKARARKQGRSKPSLEAAGFYWRLLGQPFEKNAQSGKMRRTLLLGLAQIATSGGFVQESLSRESSRREPE